MTQLPSYHKLPKNAVVCLMSPTASGKTDLACRLYETGRFELISVDSALIYKRMNIGTAKPSAEELQKFPHHLVDVIEPTQSYSVADFVTDVDILVEKIHHQNKIPLLVGGTMMYYAALFDGISSVPQTQDNIRKQVKAWRDCEGNEALYAYLQQHDAKICQKLKPSDTQRITRAVEVHMQTGRAMSDWQATPKNALSHNPKWQWYAAAVTPDRSWLHEQIAKRLDLMWRQNFLQEVIDLINFYPDLTADMPSMRCVGYRQVLEYLVNIEHACITNHPFLNLLIQSEQEKCSVILNKNQQNDRVVKKYSKTTINTRDLACQDMKNKALYATRQLAKRQYTWLRQLTSASRPIINNVTMVSFGSIQQVKEQLLHR